MLVGAERRGVVVPVRAIFGARAVDQAIRGDEPGGALLLLTSMLLFTASLTPLAASSAVRISLE